MQYQRREETDYNDLYNSGYSSNQYGSTNYRDIGPSSYDHQSNYSGTRNYYNQNDKRDYHQQSQFPSSPPMDNQYNHSNNIDSRNFQSSQYEETQSIQPDQRFISNRYSNYPQSREEYPQNDIRNIENQMYEMHIQDQYRSSQESYHTQNQFNDHMRSSHSNNIQMNNNNSTERQSYESGNFRENVNTDRNDYQPTERNPPQSYSNYLEPTRFQQVGKPQVLANTSGDGGSVAVFGVVAQVQKSPTNHDPPSNIQVHHKESGISGPQDNLTRTKHLAPIIEHPDSSPFPPHHNSANFSNYNRQGYNVPPEKRYPSQPIKPDVNAFQERPVFPKEHDRQRDAYRDEYTDSSGYGSTLTERSYEGPVHAQYRNNFNNTNYRQRQTSPDTNDFQSPRNFQYNQSKQPQHQVQQPFRYAADQSNFRSIPSNSEQSQHWSSYEQQSGTRNQHYQHESNQENTVDNSQIKSVQSVKRMFDKPGSAIPLPPTSSSYGANQYNTRPLPPRPQSQAINKNISSMPIQQYYPSEDDFYARPQQSSNQLPSTSLGHQSSNINSSRYYQTAPSNDYQQPMSPSGQPRSRGSYREEWSSVPQSKPSLEHNQGTANPDNLYSQQFHNPGEIRSRNSYTSDNDMVVGVRFEKRHPIHPRQNEGEFSSTFPQDARPSNNQSFHQKIRFSEYRQQEEPGSKRDASFNTRFRYRPNNDGAPQAWPAPVNNPPSPKRQPHLGQATHTYSEMRYERGQDADSHSYLSRNNYHEQTTSQNYPPDDRYPDQEPRPSFQPQHQRQQFDSRKQSRFVEDNRSQRANIYQESGEQLENQPDIGCQEPVEENYVPDVVQKSYGLYTQSQNNNLPARNDEEWPEPPSNVDQLNATRPPKQQIRDFKPTLPNNAGTNRTTTYQVKQVYRVPEQSQVRQEPMGRKDYQYRQVQSHPYDPTDDDSSDEVNVDAPTPPIINKNGESGELKWGRERQTRVEEKDYETNGTVTAQIDQRHPVQRREKYRNLRQPEDELKGEEQRPQTGPVPRQNPATVRLLPQKPSRNSLKQVKANSSHSQQDLSYLDRLDEDAESNLNHNHSKERARLAKAGKITRKPPSRRNSSNVLPEVLEDDSNSGYEINVTSRDLTRQEASQPIHVHFDPEQSRVNQSDSKAFKQTGDSPQTEQSSSKVSKTDPKRTMKLAFKTPSTDPIQKNPAHVLPEIQEPISKDRKLPPTYTRVGNTDKPQTTLTPDLLGLFNSSREDALRSAAKKQNRALHSVQAAVRLRKTDQSQSSNDSKRNDNRDIYNSSKPKGSRDKDESDSRKFDERRGRNGELRRDRGHSSGRAKTRSPERRDRSRERNMNRDHVTRKSDRSSHRPVSPYRGRDEAPYRRKDEPPPHSRHERRSDEPEWVEQYRKKRATNEHSPQKRDWTEDPKRRQKKEFDFDQYKRDVNKATAYNSDFEQPVRKQVIPTELLSSKGRAQPAQRPPPGNTGWMKNLKEQNKRANRNR